MTLLDWITRSDPNRTTAEYAEHFALRQRLGLEMGELPLTLTELKRQLSALARDGLIQCVDGRWEHVWVPVRVEQGQLF